ncbi:MAG: hypothetical protein ABIR39_24085 [Nocardioides sp.]|uniref:hypothetical protein n=1 Tax=Nocardioides sp. TaxID=35761 RepID=UPI003263D6CF
MASRESFDNSTDDSTDASTALALRRVLRAASGPLAAVALFAGSTIGPRLADTVTSDPVEGAKVVAAVAAERDASLWAGVFLMIGLALLVPFFAGVTAAIRGRGALLATVGGTLAMVGAVCGSLSQWFFFSEFQLTAPGVPREASIAGLTTLPAWPGILLFFGFMGGLTLGWALLCIAAWRSQVFARWQVAAFAAAWLSLAVSHTFWSALVLVVAGLAMAPTLARRPVGRVSGPVVPAGPTPARQAR